MIFFATVLVIGFLFFGMAFMYGAVKAKRNCKYVQSVIGSELDKDMVEMIVKEALDTPVFHALIMTGLTIVVTDFAMMFLAMVVTVFGLIF